MRSVSHLSLVPQRFFGLDIAARSPSRVLIVGVGALARATADDVEDLDGRSVLGHLTWEQELPHSKLRAPVLGSCTDLAECLAAYDVAEVYIAGTAQHHGDAIADAARVCEQLGVRFAVPAVGFRLTRGRPRGGQMFPDGYVHFAVPEENRVVHELLAGLRQFVRMADVLRVSMIAGLAFFGLRHVSTASIANASTD
jgi:hypothetical protein